MIDCLVRLTRPTMKKLLKLYMTDEFGNNKAFVKEAIKTFNMKEDEAHLIWQSFDIGYEFWFSRKPE
jgi:hypothetical protein